MSFLLKKLNLRLQNPISEFFIYFLLFLVIFTFIIFFTLDLEFNYRQTDLQSDTFYKALLIATGRGDPLFIQPGVLPVYTMAIITKAWSPFIQNANMIFYTAYILTAVLYSLSIVLLRRFVEIGLPKICLLFALLPLFGWPSFWYYLTTFGSDSWVFPLSIIYAVAVWRKLEHPPSNFTQTLPILIIGFACVITKLSMISLVAAGFVSILLSVMFSSEKIRKLKICILFIISVLLTHELIKINPFFNLDLYSLIKMNLISPPDYLKGHINNLYTFPKVYLLMLLIMGVFSSFIILREIFLKLIKDKGYNALTLHKSLFLIMALVLGIKGLMISSTWNPIALRHCGSTIALLPFFILFVFSYFNKAPLIWFKSRLYFIPCLVVLIYVGLQTSDTGKNRDRDVSIKLLKISSLVDKSLSKGANALVMEEVTEAGWHFYGNEAYGENKFDEEIRLAFPLLGYIRVRHYDTSGDKSISAIIEPSKKMKEEINAFVSTEYTNCKINCIVSEFEKNNFRIKQIKKIDNPKIYRLVIEKK